MEFLPKFIAKVVRLTKAEEHMESKLKKGETKGLLEKELQDLIRKQKAAALFEGVNIERRLNRIDRAISLLVENSEKIVEALKEDFGHRSREGSLATDIFGTLSKLVIFCVLSRALTIQSLAI